MDSQNMNTFKIPPRIKAEKVALNKSTPGKIQTLDNTSEQVKAKIKNVTLMSATQWKRWTWGLLSQDDCAMDNGTLTVFNNGWLNFTARLNSSDPGDDSWGILHFDFIQDNGPLLWTSGQFWSPTIQGGGINWEFWSPFPLVVLPDDLNRIGTIFMTSHC